jgi:hypothetical protein
MMELILYRFLECKERRSTDGYTESATNLDDARTAKEMRVLEHFSGKGDLDALQGRLA